MQEAEPIAYTIKSACVAADLSRTTLYEAIKARRLPARKCGNRTLILREDLKRFIENLPALAA